MTRGLSARWIPLLVGLGALAFTLALTIAVDRALGALGLGWEPATELVFPPHTGVFYHTAEFDFTPSSSRSSGRERS